MKDRLSKWLVETCNLSGCSRVCYGSVKQVCSSTQQSQVSHLRVSGENWAAEM